MRTFIWMPRIIFSFSFRGLFACYVTRHFWVANDSQSQLTSPHTFDKKSRKECCCLLRRLQLTQKYVNYSFGMFRFMVVSTSSNQKPARLSTIDGEGISTIFISRLTRFRNYDLKSISEMQGAMAICQIAAQMKNGTNRWPQREFKSPRMSEIKRHFIIQRMNGKRRKQIIS